MNFKYLIAALVMIVFSGAAAAEEQAPLPDLVQALLDAAYETNEQDEIEAVAKAVKAVFPDYAAGIEAQSSRRIAELAPADQSNTAAAKKPAESARPKPRGFFALSPWKGKVNAGASLASGNSDNFAAGVSMNARRTDRGMDPQYNRVHRYR